MREGARMAEEEEEEEEEEKGMRAGCEERRSDSRLLPGVPLTPSPMGCCSLPTSGGVSSGLRCPFGAVPAPVVVHGSPPGAALTLCLSQSFTRGGSSC